MEKIWYIIRETEHIGPYDEDDLQDMFENDQLTAGTAVWRSGMDNPIPFANLMNMQGKEFEFNKDTQQFKEIKFTVADEDEDDIDSILGEELEEERAEQLAQEIAEKEALENTPPPLPLEVQQPAVKEMKIERLDDDESLGDSSQTTNAGDSSQPTNVEDLEGRDEIYEEEHDFDTVEIEDETITEVTIKKPKNWFLLVPVMLICLVSLKLSYEVYSVYFKKFSRPVGMKLRDYNRLIDFLGERKTPQYADFAFSKDYSKLWVAINFPFKGRAQLILESVKDKVMTDDPIYLTSSGKIKNKHITFRDFHYEKGVKLFPGYYKMTVRLLNKRKLGFWIESLLSHSTSFEITEEVYLGKHSQEKFDELLVKYLNKRNSEDRAFWQDLYQRFDTLKVITNQIYEEFKEIVKKTDVENFTAEIKKFEKNYIRNYGNFLTSFVLENKNKYKEVETSFVKDRNALIGTHQKLASTSKQIGEISMDILMKLEHIKKENLENDIQFIRTQLISKLISIEIQCKNQLSVISNKYL